MKTVKEEVFFTEDVVQQYVKNVGDDHPMYKSIENAQAFGYECIPLPPTMPTIAYRDIEVPWEFKPPIILRKQQCDYHEIMYVNQAYKATLTLEKPINRHHYTFVKQVLQLYDLKGTLCFMAISDMVVGGIQ